MVTPRFVKPIAYTGEVSIFVQWFCRLVLRIWGWKIQDWVIPNDMQKVVVIGEHHTSNTDGFLMVFVVAAMGRRLSWLVKSELNQPIIGAMIRATGGIFVDRHAPNGTVGEVIREFAERDQLFLIMAPSSTRSKTDHWRTGFYYMADGADVPIGFGYLDYKNKTAGIGKLITPSGDIKADEPIFQAYYKNITGLYPEKASNVRLHPRPMPGSAQQKAS